MRIVFTYRLKDAEGVTKLASASIPYDNARILVGAKDTWIFDHTGQGIDRYLVHDHNEAFIIMDDLSSRRLFGTLNLDGFADSPLLPPPVKVPA